MSSEVAPMNSNSTETNRGGVGNPRPETAIDTSNASEQKVAESLESKMSLALNVADLATLVSIPLEKTIEDLKNLGCKSKSQIPPGFVRKFLATKGFRYKHEIISFQMLKGGVAKTTSALNFGIRAAMYGSRVLFVDLDQQANLTFALGIENPDERRVWVDIVEKESQIEETIVTIADGVDLIPSSLNNSVLDRVLLTGQKNWSLAVKGPLQSVFARYDLVVIDTAPNLSAINTAVTCASNTVILPVSPDKFSMLGLKKHLEDLNELRQEFVLNFRSKILFTKFDGRENLSSQILDFCLEQYPTLMLKTFIRTSTDIKNSIGTKRGVFGAKSSAKEDYDLVTREILGFS